MIEILIGTVLGGCISVLTTLINSHSLKRSRILDKQLFAYQEIAKALVQEKLHYEEQAAHAASVKLKQKRKEISDDDASIEYKDVIEQLSSIHTRIYTLFSYSYILDTNIIDKINILSKALASSMNPNNLLNTSHLTLVGDSFVDVIEAISVDLGLKPNINIDNPHKLASVAILDR